jgi:hypothetical protein
VIPGRRLRAGRRQRRFYRVEHGQWFIEGQPGVEARIEGGDVRGNAFV